MRVTLDTAILIRTNAKATGPAKELLDAIKRSGAVLVLSPFLLSEVDRVLRYPRVQAIYRLTDADIQEHIDYLQAFAEVVTPFEGPPVVLKDPDDDPVVYTALAGAADVICTVDRHFYEPNVLSFCSKYGISVIDDLELLETLRRGRSQWQIPSCIKCNRHPPKTFAPASSACRTFRYSPPRTPRETDSRTASRN